MATYIIIINIINPTLGNSKPGKNKHTSMKDITGANSLSTPKVLSTAIIKNFINTFPIIKSTHTIVNIPNSAI